MLTEAEAKTKWCPMVKVLSVVTGTNRDRHEGTNCIGTACMMWRWNAEEDGLKKPIRVHPNVLTDHWKGWTVTNDKPDERGYVEISPPPPKKATGYCGLAGAAP